MASKFNEWLKLKIAYASKWTRSLTQNHGLQKATYTASAIIGLSSILIAGPYLQLVTTSLLSSDQTSLYSGAYQDEIAHFLTARQWLSAIIDTQYLMCAGLIVITAIFCLDAKTFLIRVSAAAAFGLSVIDTYAIDWPQSPPAEELAVSLACNVTGGFLIAALLLVTFKTSGTARHLAGKNIHVERLLRITWPLLWGLILSVSLFLLFKLLLHIPSTAVYIRSTPP